MKDLNTGLNIWVPITQWGREHSRTASAKAPRQKCSWHGQRERSIKDDSRVLDFAKMLNGGAIYWEGVGGGQAAGLRLRRRGSEEGSLWGLSFAMFVTQLGVRFRKEPWAEERSGLAPWFGHQWPTGHVWRRGSGWVHPGSEGSRETGMSESRPGRHVFKCCQSAPLKVWSISTC